MLKQIKKITLAATQPSSSIQILLQDWLKLKLNKSSSFKSQLQQAIALLVWLNEAETTKPA